MNINDDTVEFRQKLSRISASTVILDKTHEDTTAEIEQAVQNELIDTLVHFTGVLELIHNSHHTKDTDVWKDMDTETALNIYETMHALAETDGLVSLDEEMVEDIGRDILRYHGDDSTKAYIRALDDDRTLDEIRQDLGLNRDE